MQCLNIFDDLLLYTLLFSSISKPAFITVKDDENIYIASHVLELSNYGPSILPEADLTVRYPQVQMSGRAQLYLNKTTVCLTNRFYKCILYLSLVMRKCVFGSL